jgi:flagellar export protein FliJ
MAQYKFRLETLQKVREATRDEHRASLAESFRAEQILAESRAEVVAEADALRALQRSASAGRYLDVNRLLEAQRYELLLKARSEELAKQAILVAAETERRRQVLVESDREVRVLDKLDERKRHEFMLAQHRLETKQLDEVAAVRWRGNKTTI